MKRILPLFCCLLLSGCTVKLLYSQLDWLIPWYLSDFVDFTQEQNALLRQQVSQQLEWHRSTQLPSYAVSIYRVVNDLEDGLDHGELDAHYLALENYWQDLVRRITPDAAMLLETTSDDQVQALLTKLDEKNREYASEYVEPPNSKLRRNREKRLRKHIKRWLGSLTESQRLAIADWNRRFVLISADSLKYRRVWRQQFAQLLAQRWDNGTFPAKLQQLVLYPERTWSRDYQRKLDINRELSKDFILEMDRLMTAEQRTHLMRKLGSLATDFNRLASAD